MKGTVTFHWENGFKLEKPIFSILCGIIDSEGNRPDGYSLVFTESHFCDNIENKRYEEWKHRLDATAKELK